MNIFKSFFKSRDKPRNASVGTSWFHIGRSWSGKAVTERTALQQTAVYDCVRIIAETIASLPLHLYKYTDNGKEKDCTHPLYYLLHDEPNREMTAFVFRETITAKARSLNCILCCRIRWRSTVRILREKYITFIQIPKDRGIL